MAMIRRTSPFGELLSLRQAMDRRFDDSLFRPLAGINREAGRGASHLDAGETSGGAGSAVAATAALAPER